MFLYGSIWVNRKLYMHEFPIKILKLLQITSLASDYLYVCWVYSILNRKFNKYFKKGGFKLSKSPKLSFDVQ